jgi:nitroreductase
MSRTRSRSHDCIVETWDAVRSRRDVREYAERPVDAQHLQRILEAGRRAPSSSNWQPWDFIVVTDRDALRELADVRRGARHVASSAVTIALVAPVPLDGVQRERVQYDLGQATMSIMLAAADLGIGSAHAAVTDAGPVHTMLGLPADRFCPYLIALGYPASRPLAPITRPKRRPFDDVVHRERW